MVGLRALAAEFIGLEADSVRETKGEGGGGRGLFVVWRSVREGVGLGRRV
jgi:hypothetical protein